ncbi:helix-turn-helix domain-containing protein [uncultured Roseobacter sp.]|uniref:helix-turn-helix domain-containing protein n=1 Tax=uncultured Roseobacter sp. TaxID=114847 RepID=UPI0026351A6B|nr:helix-turn-helix domain-containing protein [uncultured Roseobacter sp.]
MDRRDLSAGFKERLAQVLASHPTGKGQFLRDVGMDRSALSQFLSPDSDRLPRAETLRRIARVSGVSVDWLLCLENAPEGRQEVAESVQIEKAVQADGSTPLDKWRSAASGFKLRYVPSTLPDIVSFSPENVPDARGGGVENVLGQVSLDDMDVEIAMPAQTVRDLSARTGLWRGADPEQCREQLTYMAGVCRQNYPALRLHLYDGTQTFSAPFTVFGKQRVALYIGDAYLVISSPDQIRGFAKQFDRLVRRAIIGADVVHEMLDDLAARVR